MYKSMCIYLENFVKQLVGVDCWEAVYYVAQQLSYASTLECKHYKLAVVDVLVLVIRRHKAHWLIQEHGRSI
jgi:hypothetical protein